MASSPVDEAAYLKAVQLEPFYQKVIAALRANIGDEPTCGFTIGYEADTDGHATKLAEILCAATKPAGEDRRWTAYVCAEFHAAVEEETARAAAEMLLRACNSLRVAIFQEAVQQATREIEDLNTAAAAEADKVAARFRKKASAGGSKQRPRQSKE
jgi:hypothetical protein